MRTNFTNARSSILGFVKEVCVINKAMDTSDAALLVMHEDSDLSDFELSDDGFSGDDSDSNDDAPIRLQGVWGPAGRQPAANAFLGRQ